MALIIGEAALAAWAAGLTDADLRQAVKINAMVAREARLAEQSGQSWARKHGEKALARLEAVTRELDRRGTGGTTH